MKIVSKTSILTTLLITLLLPFSVIKAEEDLSKDDIEALEQKEKEREQNFLDQLMLTIPSMTDNPSHTITFTDPSENKAGVEIDLDDKGFEQITSPFSLPALSIGLHTLRFKFTDKYDSIQTIEKEVIVIPRPPIINTPSITNDYLKISGLGLANSDLFLILSSSRDTSYMETNIDKDGVWDIEMDIKDLREGVYTFAAYTRKYGYAGNLSEPTTFQIGDGDELYFNGEEEKDIYFRFKDISFSNLATTISQNSDLVILSAISFITGFILSKILASIFKNSLDKKSLLSLEKKINGKGTKNTSKELTLKEKLSNSNDEDEKEEVVLEV